MSEYLTKFLLHSSFQNQTLSKQLFFSLLQDPKHRVVIICCAEIEIVLFHHRWHEKSLEWKMKFGLNQINVSKWNKKARILNNWKDFVFNNFHTLNGWIFMNLYLIFIWLRAIFMEVLFWMLYEHIHQLCSVSDRIFHEKWFNVFRIRLSGWNGWVLLKMFEKFK